MTEGNQLLPGSEEYEIFRRAARLRLLRREKSRVEAEIADVQSELVGLLAGQDEQPVFLLPAWETDEHGAERQVFAEQRLQVNGKDPKVSVNMKLLAAERPDLAAAVQATKADSDKVKAALKKGLFTPEDIGRYFAFADPSPWVQFYDPIPTEPAAGSEDDAAVAELFR